MKFWKKMIFMSMLLVVLFAQAIPVQADLILTPTDPFYSTHRDDCKYNNNRKYLINSELGYAYLYENPESKISIKSYTNGDEVTISYLYTDKDGVVWGYLPDYELPNSGSDWDDGWFCMSELSVIYDSFSFLEDYEKECIPYDKGESIIEISKENSLILWKYPGGKTVADFSTQASINLQDYVSLVYTDKNGNEWGYVPYIYGMRNTWIFLSDLFNDKPDNYVADEKEIELKHDPVPLDEIPMNKNNLVMYIIVGLLVVAAIVVSIIIIKTMYGKKKTEH